MRSSVRAPGGEPHGFYDTHCIGRLRDGQMRRNVGTLAGRNPCAEYNDAGIVTDVGKKKDKKGETNHDRVSCQPQSHPFLPISVD